MYIQGELNQIIKDWLEQLTAENGINEQKQFLIIRKYEKTIMGKNRRGRIDKKSEKDRREYSKQVIADVDEPRTETQRHGFDKQHRSQERNGLLMPIRSRVLISRLWPT